ncbi:MAG TPA: helix-turn-helix domain-containing protein [Ktedonobacterales bacterium]|nr:helix-turn-helix domain-containing protein [Ktedonobacterales bacterium]
MTSQDHDRDRSREPVPLSQRLLLRPEEVAAILGLGRSTIYELLRAGELPTVHIGRATRIPARDLHRWIEQRITADGANGPDDVRNGQPTTR